MDCHAGSLTAGEGNCIDPNQMEGPAMSLHDLKLGSPDCGDCPIRHRAVCARCESDELKRLEPLYMQIILAVKFSTRFLEARVVCLREQLLKLKHVVAYHPVCLLMSLSL